MLFSLDLERLVGAEAVVRNICQRIAKLWIRDRSTNVRLIDIGGAGKTDASRADVVYVQHCILPELILRIQVPVLHVSIMEVPVHEGTGRSDGRCWLVENVLNRCGAVRIGDRKRIAERRIEACIQVRVQWHDVIEHSERRTNHKSIRVEGLPGQTDARSEVME